MPSLTDLFTPTFFMFLGITTLLLALVVVYFESKMREQNHKIISMVSLVSAMTDELNIIRSNISLLNTVNYENIGGSSQNDKIIFTPSLNPTSLPSKTIVSNNLIEVSDDSSSDDEDEDEEEDEEDSDTAENVNGEDEEEEEADSDSDSDSESSDSSSEEVIQIIEDILPNSDIQDLKILKLDSLENSGEFKNEPNLVFENLDNEESQTQENSGENEHDDANEINLISSADLKTINISELADLEEYKQSNNDTLETTEIKKLSLTKLRSLVLEKGLSNEVSKLKKHELLKLLGIE